MSPLGQNMVGCLPHSGALNKAVMLSAVMFKDGTELIGQRGEESNPRSGTAYAKGLWWDRHGGFVGQKGHCGCSTDGEWQNSEMSLKECLRPGRAEPCLPSKESVPHLTSNPKIDEGHEQQFCIFKRPSSCSVECSLEKGQIS